MINFLRVFGTRSIKTRKNWPIFSSFNPFPSMPSVATGDRKQFQYLQIVLNNKTRSLVLKFNWCKDTFQLFIKLPNSVTMPLWRSSVMIFWTIFTYKLIALYWRNLKVVLYFTKIEKQQRGNKYLLLTEFEGRTVSYGPSFSPRFMAQTRSARAINRRGKNEDP